MTGLVMILYCWGEACTVHTEMSSWWHTLLIREISWIISLSLSWWLPCFPALLKYVLWFFLCDLLTLLDIVHTWNSVLCSQISWNKISEQGNDLNIILSVFCVCEEHSKALTLAFFPVSFVVQSPGRGEDAAWFRRQQRLWVHSSGGAGAGLRHQGRSHCMAAEQDKR